MMFGGKDSCSFVSDPDVPHVCAVSFNGLQHQNGAEKRQDRFELQTTRNKGELEKRQESSKSI